MSIITQDIDMGTPFNYRMAMPTPWGKADSKTKVAPGVYEVSTPGHGGILVGQAVARKCLSVEAMSIGEPFGRFLAFEEDCAYAAVYADRPDWYRAACEAGVFDDYAAAQASAERGEFYPNRAATDEQIRAYFLGIVARWFPNEYRFRAIIGIEAETDSRAAAQREEANS